MQRVAYMNESTNELSATSSDLLRRLKGSLERVQQLTQHIQVMTQQLSTVSTRVSEIHHELASLILLVKDEDPSVPQDKIDSLLEEIQELSSGVSSSLNEGEQQTPPVNRESTKPESVKPESTDTSTSGSPSEVISGPERTEEDLQVIDPEKWLNDRGITICTINQPEHPLGDSLNRFALFLGDRYETLKDFARVLKKKSAGAHRANSLSLKNKSESEISHVVQFGNDLKRNALLQDFRYVKKDRVAFFELQDEGIVKNFFTGDWLERYVQLKVVEVLKQLLPDVTPKVLANAAVEFPSGEKAEFDLIVGLDSKVLWLECKSGKDYPKDVSKYGGIAKNHIKIEPQDAALVLLVELTDEEKTNNSHFAGMQVIHMTQLESFLRSTLGKAPASEAIPPATSTVDSLSKSENQTSALQPTVSEAHSALKSKTEGTPSVSSKVTSKLNPTSNSLRKTGGNRTSPKSEKRSGTGTPIPPKSAPSPYASCLNHHRLRPLTYPVRQKILLGLRTLSLEQGQTSIRQLCDVLHKQFQSESVKDISKSMISDVITALIRSGCCLHDDNPDREKEIWYLQAEFSEEKLHDSCVKLYLWQLFKSFSCSQMMQDDVGIIIDLFWGESLDQDEAFEKMQSLIQELILEGNCEASFDPPEELTITPTSERYGE